MEDNEQAWRRRQEGAWGILLDESDSDKALSMQDSECRSSFFSARSTLGGLSVWKLSDRLFLFEVVHAIVGGLMHRWRERPSD